MNERTSLIKKNEINHIYQNKWNANDNESLWYASYPKKKILDKAHYVMVKVDDLPYDLPKAYSLENERKILFEVSLRTKKMQKRMYRTDLEAIASDWIKVGKNINESIRRYSERLEF